MTDPYRGSRSPGAQRRGSHDDALDGFLSEISGRGSARVSDYRDPGRHSHDGYGDSGYGDSGYGGSGRHSRDDYDGYDYDAPTGRASVGRASVGRAAVGSAAVGSAAVGRASVPVRPGAPGGPGGPGRPGGPGGPGDRRGRGPSQLAKKRKRRRKLVAMGAVAVMLTGLVMLAGTYFVVNVPTPSDLASLSQNSTILDAKGGVLAKVGTENRTYVKIDKIPKHVQHAVVTAEDRTFYSNSGIDVKGILRAAWNNITDDDTEGASTITQQYVRNAANLTRDVSYTRKLKEAVMAVKLNQELSKDEILEYYLNTIYFGRNAYGIEAASQAYFKKPVAKLTPEEGALLAGVIKNPSGYDPENNPEKIKERWHWVLTGMVDMKWHDAGALAKAQFPKTIPSKEAIGAQFGLTKPTGHVVKHVKSELAKLGITPDMLNTGGYTIHTTINPKMQKAAEQAVAKVMKGQPGNLASSLVAVQPGTGRVVAYYGGKDGAAGLDYAGYHQPGSSFKAYVLAAALANGISVKSYWDGSSPMEFPDRDKPIRNSENTQCKNCTLERATVLSLNTTYYALASKLGKDKVLELASKAGIRGMQTDARGDAIDLTTDPAEASKNFGNEIGIGQYPVTVLDHANGFATFAANGVRAEAHFVDKVMQGGEELHKITPKTSRAFDAEVAADATYVLRKVVGAGENLKDGRAAAGKTGTQDLNGTAENVHAWMCGYTPQVAAAAWVGNKGDEKPLRTASGRKIYGSGLPSEIWRTFMNTAHSGMKNEEFPKAAFNGDEGAGNAKSPSPSVSPSGKPTKPGKPDPTPAPTGSPISPSPDCRPPSPWCENTTAPAD
ncbi:MAG: transglycosylase domain-containing protein [Micromonosporaceae bacterium]